MLASDRAQPAGSTAPRNSVRAPPCGVRAHVLSGGGHACAQALICSAAQSSSGSPHAALQSSGAGRGCHTYPQMALPGVACGPRRLLSVHILLEPWEGDCHLKDLAPLATQLPLAACQPSRLLRCAGCNASYFCLPDLGLQPIQNPIHAALAGLCHILAAARLRNDL